MRRRFKLLAVLIGVPVVLVLVAAIVLPMLIDSSYYKRQATALAKEHTGHELHIDGVVRLHVFPSLRLTVSDIRLANPPGFSTSDLARLPWLMVDVKLLPLLAGRIEPQAVDVVGLRLNLERDSRGRGNWEAAAAVEQDPDTRQGTATDTLLAAMAIGALDVRDATLHWRDQVSNESITVSAIALQTGALHGGKGIDDVRLRATLLEGDATIEARGDVALSEAGGILVIPKLAMTFRDFAIAGMRADGTLSTRLTVDFAKQRLTLDTMRVSARASGSENRQIAAEITTALDFDLLQGRLTESLLSLNVPTYSLSGIDGDLVLKGVLSGDLRAGTVAFERIQGSGTMGGEALADSDIAFALAGTMNADLEGRKILASGLEITGSVDGDRLPFRFIADLDMSQRARTLTAKGMRLTLGDWQLDGAMTVRATASPPGVQGVLELEIQGQPLAGSFAVTESSANTNGVDVRFDVVADLDIEEESFLLRGRSAVVLRAEVNPPSAHDSWQVRDLQMGARLSDASIADGELTIKLRADLKVDVNSEVVHSDNLRVTVDDSRITGSVTVRDFDKPAVRFDLQADAIDADRYLRPVAAGSEGSDHAAPVGAFIDAVRALDFTGEVRVQKLTLKGVQMENVRLTSDSNVGGG